MTGEIAIVTAPALHGFLVDGLPVLKFQIGRLLMRTRYLACARPNMPFYSMYEMMKWIPFQQPKRKYCHYIRCYSETSTTSLAPSTGNGLILVSAFVRITTSAWS